MIQIEHDKPEKQARSRTIPKLNVAQDKIKKHNRLPESFGSQQFRQYKNFMGNESTDNVTNYLEQLAKANIQYHPEFFVPKFMIKFIQDTPGSKVITFKVSFSYFTMLIRMYNENGTSRGQMGLTTIGSGSFSSIYLYINQELGLEYVIKNIPFTKPKDGQESMKIQIKLAIYQFCLYKLASSLRIGPKLQNYFGFDLITYQNSIQFSMQHCQRTNDLYEQELRRNLKIMHSLRLVHGDIKEENIMYSPAYDRNVFIDFNCSSIVQQQIGQKSLTCFKGTITYVSPQMQKLFLSNLMGYVDLYYNDVYGLKNQLKNQQTLRKNNEYKKKKQDITIAPEILGFYLHMLLRFHIFQEDQENIKKHMAKYKNFVTITQKIRLSAKQALLLGKQDGQKQVYKFGQSRLIIKMMSIINETFNFLPEIGSYEHKKKLYHLVYTIFERLYDLKQLKRTKFEINRSKAIYKNRFEESLSQQQYLTIEEIKNKNFLMIILNSQLKSVSDRLSNNELAKMKKQKQEKACIESFYKLLTFNPRDQILISALKVIKIRKYVQFPQDISLLEKMRMINIKYKGDIIKNCRIISLMSEQSYHKYVDDKYHFRYTKEQIQTMLRKGQIGQNFLSITGGFQRLRSHIKTIEEDSKINNRQYLKVCYLFLNELEEAHKLEKEKWDEKLYQLQKKIEKQVPKFYQKSTMLALSCFKIARKSFVQSDFSEDLIKLEAIQIDLKKYGIQKDLRNFCDFFRCQILILSQNYRQAQKVMQKIQENKTVISYLAYHSAIYIEIMISLREDSQIDLADKFEAFESMCYRGSQFLGRTINILKETSIEKIEFLKYLIKKIAIFYRHIDFRLDYPKIKIQLIKNYEIFFVQKYLIVYPFAGTTLLGQFLASIKSRFSANNYPPKVYQILLETYCYKRQMSTFYSYFQESYRAYPNFSSCLVLAIVRCRSIFFLLTEINPKLIKPQSQFATIYELFLKKYTVNHRICIPQLQNIGQYFCSNPAQFFQYFREGLCQELFKYLYYTENSKILFGLWTAYSLAINNIQQKVPYAYLYHWAVQKSLLYFNQCNFKQPMVLSSHIIALQEQMRSSFSPNIFLISNAYGLLQHLVHSKVTIPRHSGINLAKLKVQLIKYIIKNIQNIIFPIKRRITVHFVYYFLLLAQQNNDLLRYNAIKNNRQRWQSRMRLRLFRQKQYKQYSCNVQFIQRVVISKFLPQRARRPIQAKLENIIINKKQDIKITYIDNFPKNLHRLMQSSINNHNFALKESDTFKITNTDKSQLLYWKGCECKIKITKPPAINSALLIGFMGIMQHPTMLEEILFDGHYLFLNGIRINQKQQKQLGEHEAHVYINNYNWKEEDLIQVMPQYNMKQQFVEKLLWIINNKTVAEYRHPLFLQKRLSWRPFFRKTDKKCSFKVVL